MTLMNEGIIASRYARALLRLTAETGRGEQVFAQVDGMLDDAGTIPAHPEPDLKRLVALMKEHGRESLLKRTLYVFRTLYCDAAGVKIGHLTTVVPDAELTDKLRTMMESRTGCKVIIKTATDPRIEGGFIFEIDGLTMDASVRAQIEKIRRQFIVRNRRLV